MSRFGGRDCSGGGLQAERREERLPWVLLSRLLDIINLTHSIQNILEIQASYQQKKRMIVSYFSKL